MTNKVYEVWYDFYDGTQANLGGYQKRIKTFISKDKAIEEKERLNKEFKYENPYYVREVELDD